MFELMMESKFKIKDLPKLLKETFKEYMEEEPFELSAIVAYYSIFSLPALLMILVSVAGLLFGQEAVQGKISGQIGAMLGQDAGKEIQTMIQSSYKSGNTVIGTIIGIAVLLFGATGVFLALQKSLNKIWEVKPDPEKSGIKKLIFDRATSFGIILAIGFLLLISLVITAGLTIVSDWLSVRLPDFLVAVFHLVNIPVSFGIVMLVFALLYKFLPDVKISWKSVWIGSAVTAFLFVLGKFALSLYFGKAEPGSTYGAAGSIVLILLWVSYSCMILFFGAEFTQVYSKYYAGDIQPSDHAVKSQES